ncbi:MAG TPA: hypothetical protein VLK85_13690 [Ramlibacter sp.]|nr:hypothetical protein [Ramlibacter sp.]
MADVKPSACAPGYAGTQAGHLIKRAARRDAPLQSLRRATRHALDSLCARLDADLLSHAGSSLGAAHRQQLALLSIAALALECSHLRPGAIPAATELGWRELRRRILEAHLQARGASAAADRELFDDYLAAVDASAVCVDLRGQLAGRLLASKGD